MNIAQNIFIIKLISKQLINEINNSFFDLREQFVKLMSRLFGQS